MHRLTAVDGFGERLVDEFAHLGGRDEVLAGSVSAGDVGGAVAGFEHLADGGFDGGGVLFQVGGVAETMAAVRIAPSGLALPVPAMSGADPCTGS